MAEFIQQHVPGCPFAIVAMPGKGLGAVATRSIARGERILSEPPLVALTEGQGEDALNAAVAALSAHIREIFYSL